MKHESEIKGASISKDAVRAFVVNIMEGRLRSNLFLVETQAFEGLEKAEQDKLVLEVFHASLKDRNARIAEAEAEREKTRAENARIDKEIREAIKARRAERKAKIAPIGKVSATKRPVAAKSKSIPADIDQRIADAVAQAIRKQTKAPTKKAKEAPVVETTPEVVDNDKSE